MARAQLRPLGLGDDAIDVLVRAGWLVRLHRGVYRAGHVPLGADGRRMAAVLACGAGAALSHRSAADAWGMRPTASSMLEVTAPSARSRRPGIAVHRCRLAPDEVTHVRGIPLTTPARTLLDLAGTLGARELGRAAEEAERRQIFDLRAIEAVLAAHPRRAGRAHLRAILEDGLELAPTRSELERRVLDLCAGLPRPEVNVLLHGYEVDFVWRDARLVVEVDGRDFHGTRAAFERDRARDAELTALGWRVVRFTWRQVTREPRSVAATLAKLLA